MTVLLGDWALQLRQEADHEGRDIQAYAMKQRKKHSTPPPGGLNLHSSKKEHISGGVPLLGVNTAGPLFFTLPSVITGHVPGTTTAVTISDRGG